MAVAEDTTAPVTVAVGDSITVKEFADLASLKVTDVIGQLMKNGVMATINDRIDRETATIVGTELGVAVSQATAERAVAERSTDKAPSAATTAPRPPVIAVMGHVDHGKTTLLDAIRKSEVAKKEAGGITQHLSAYQIEHKGKHVTFLDTPGHEAFSLLREHGAHLTDVAIIVVAADDGVKPQTEEAINFAQKAGVKMLVAITKIDKTGVDTNRTKQQLADKGLNPEEWGGDTVMVEVSAKTGQNVDKLIDMALLVADIEELRARPDGPAEGIVIEAHMATGQGPVATLLVERGQLKVSDFVVAGPTYSKVRTMTDSTGQPLTAATPSTPVLVSGWKTLPDLGQVFMVVENEKAARSQSEQARRQVAVQSSAEVKKIHHEDKLEAAMAADKVKQLPLVLKADVHGSLESLLQSLESIGTDEVQAKVISQGVGAISESDVALASSSGAQIIGFNVNLPVPVKQLAQRQKVSVHLYKVIYELLDDVRESLSKLLTPEIVEETSGELTVKGIFRLSKNSVICGGAVTAGKIVPDLLVRKLGGDEPEEIGVVKNVQREQQVVKEVKEGEMCGLELSTAHKANLNLEDKLQFFSRQEKVRSL